MSEELKPCIWCGEEGQPLAANDGGKRLFWTVLCTGCNVGIEFQDSYEEAVAMWNRRTGEGDE